MTSPVASAYVLMVFLTVAAPGPGQLMTVQHAIEQGWGAAMWGVVGLCLGTVVMSTVSVLGVGGLVQVVPQAIWLLQLAGAGYLLYLARMVWLRAADVPMSSTSGRAQRRDRAWILARRGFLLQTVNPKPVLFFLAVLPSVAINQATDRVSVWRAVAAIGVYLVALLVVHGLLGAIVVRTRQALASPAAVCWLRRASAVCFVAFAALLVFR